MRERFADIDVVRRGTTPGERAQPLDAVSDIITAQQRHRRSPGDAMQDPTAKTMYGVSPPAASSAFGKDSWNAHAMRSKNGARAMRRGSKYDNVMPSAAGASLTTWDHVIKSVETAGQPSNRYMGPRELFNTLDKNGDGFIDAAELRSHLGSSSKDADSLVDGRGKISYAEFTSVLGQRRKSVSPVPTPPNLTPTASPGSSPVVGSSLTRYYAARPTGSAPPPQRSTAAIYNNVTEKRWNESFIDFN